MDKYFQLIELPKVSKLTGDLTFIEGGRHIPFDIERIYYLYNVPKGVKRANHAHKTLLQIFIAISGSFDVTFDNGSEKHSIHLDCPHLGLYVPPMIWCLLENFSTGAVCIVLASALYDESDYFRDYEDFLKALKE